MLTVMSGAGKATSTSVMLRVAVGEIVADTLGVTDTATEDAMVGVIVAKIVTVGVSVDSGVTVRALVGAGVGVGKRTSAGGVGVMVGRKLAALV